MLTATKTDNKKTNSGAAANLVKPKAKKQDKNGIDALASFEGVGIQMKLTIGDPGDKYEQEADRVADRVVSMPAPRPVQGKCADCEAKELVPNKSEGTEQKRPLTGDITHWVQKQEKRKKEPAQSKLIQRQVERSEIPIAQRIGEEEKEGPVQTKRFSPENGTPGADIFQRVRSLEGGGQAIPGETRNFFEERYNRDFSQVRIHDNPHASETANSLNARAFTLGHNIVFRRSEYAPATRSGQRLLAHELTHVIQQGAANRVARKPTPKKSEIDDEIQGNLVSSGSYSITVSSPSGQMVLGPPELSSTGEALSAPPPTSKIDSEQPETLPEEDAVSLQIQRFTNNTSLWIQRMAAFTNPTPQPQDPLARMASGNTPGLTTLTINGNVMANHQQILAQITPTSIIRTATTGGNPRCKFDPSTMINTSANMIVATNAGPTGWTGNFPANALGNVPGCAAGGAIPYTMTALPNNPTFVNTVRNSEGEHATELRKLHNRHLVPYDRFIQGLTATGPTLQDCGQNLMAQINNRNFQAALAVTMGNQAQVERFDAPGGTHTDQAAIAPANAACSAMTLTINPPIARIPGAGPGNVVPIAPTVIAFNPNTITVVGTDVKQGNTVIKHFSSAAIANIGLNAIQHYSMNTRNVVGAMEYFLIGGNAPSGTLAGANELAINMDNYQVTFDFPTPGQWAITEMVGNNINILMNFGNNRDQAYSAINVMRQHRFTHLGWVGGTRQAPEMLYFRTSQPVTVKERRFSGGGRIEWTSPGGYLVWNFNINSHTLKREHQSELGLVAADINSRLTQNPNLEVEVEGQASLTGTDAINGPLSRRRAEAVRNALVKAGVAQASIRVVFVGSLVSQPATSQENLSRSRAALIRLVPRAPAPNPKP